MMSTQTADSQSSPVSVDKAFVPPVALGTEEKPQAKIGSGNEKKHHGSENGYVRHPVATNSEAV